MSSGFKYFKSLVSVIFSREYNFLIKSISYLNSSSSLAIIIRIIKSIWHHTHSFTEIDITIRKSLGKIYLLPLYKLASALFTLSLIPLLTHSCHTTSSRCESLKIIASLLNRLDMKSKLFYIYEENFFTRFWICEEIFYARSSKKNRHEAGLRGKIRYFIAISEKICSN